MMLREHPRPLEVYCTSMVYQDLTGGYPLFRVLEDYCRVEWHAVPVDGEPFTIPEIGGLRFTAVPLRSEAPPYSLQRGLPMKAGAFKRGISPGRPSTLTTTRGTPNTFWGHLKCIRSTRQI